MSINPLTFGSPVYSPPFSVSPGDTDVMKLRSMETAPLSHESLDENFTNLANKINEILGLNIDEVNITSDGIISPANLGISAGSGLLLSASGVFTHQVRPAPGAGFSTTGISSASRRFVSGLDIDSFGHIKGWQAGTLNFTGSGSVSVDQSSTNQITISSSAYTSGSSPSFLDITATGKLSASSFFLKDSAFEMWHREYLGVSETSHPRVVQENGNNLEDGGVYRLTAHIHATETHTATRVVLWNEDGIWRVNQTTSSGDSMNHVEFYVDSTNIPRIRTWHSSPYTVQVLHERIYLKQISNANDRGIFGMDAMLSQIPEEQGALYFNRQQNKNGTVRGQKLIMDDGNGNVGIGTANPNEALHVITSTMPVQILAERTIDQHSLFSAKNSNNDQVWFGLTPGGSFAAGHDVDLEANGDFFITSSGNVGIGTATPDARLTVAQGSGTIAGNDLTQACFLAGTSSTGIGIDDNEIIKKQGTNGGSLNIGSQGIDADIRFKTGANTGQLPYERMRIDSSGNVGIGTGSPDYKLHVNGGGYFAGENMPNTQTANGIYLGQSAGGADSHVSIISPADRSCVIDFSTTTRDAIGRILYANPEASITQGMHFFADYAGNNNDPDMFIDSDGNVGIGTTSPEGKLEITHSGTWNNPSIHIKGQYPTIKFNDTNTSEDDWYIHINSNNFYILVDRGASLGDDPIDDNDNSWDTPHPLQLEGDTNKAYLFGNEILTNGYTGHLQTSSFDVRPVSTTTASSRISVDAYRQETVGGVTTGILQEWELYNNGNNSYFGLYDRTGGKYVWTAKTNGNVGIGTTNPGSSLHVAGEIGTSPAGDGVHLGLRAGKQAIIQLNGDDYGYIDFCPDGEDWAGRILYDNRDDQDYMRFDTAGAEAMRIDSNRNIGIGTTHPEGKLEIYDSTGGWSDPHLHLKGNNPTIKFNDTDASSDDFYLYTNSNNFYVLVDRGASGEDTPADDAGNVWESPNPLQLEGDTNKGYLFGSEIVTKDFTGDLNVSGTLTTNHLSIKDGAVYMWHRSYSVSSSSFQVLKMEDGSELATGGVYRVTAHIPATGTHTGATAVYWNSDGKWYCNQTTGAGNNSNHIGFIVLSDGKPAIRTWHSTAYSVSVYHERMYLGENDTENTSQLFGLDGIISKPPGDDNLYYNRYTSETGLAGGSEGRKILTSSHVYNGWDVFLHENSGMLMSYTVPQAANHWFGCNVTYDSAGFKGRYDGQVVWGKYDSNAATSTVHTLYAARATADNQAVSTTDNQVFSLTCDFNSTRKRVSAYAGTELLLNEQDVETSHTKHGDWISTYSSSHTRDVFYNRVYRQTELKAQVSGDVTSGAAHKAVRVPPGCRKFKVSVLAHGSTNRSAGFYIGVAELDSELPIGKLAICHNSQYGDSTVVEDTRYQWLRSNGSITTSRQPYTYEFEVADTCKWFSVFILNWTSMSTDTLYFDPDIKIEPIHSEFGQSQGLAYSDFSVRNSSGGYTSGLTWVGEDNSYANYTWHRQGGHVHVDIQIHRKVAVGISNVGAVYFNGLPYPAYEPSYSGGYNNTTYSNGGSHGMGVRTFGHDFVHFNTGTLDGAGVLTMECPSGDLTNGSTTGTIRGSVDYMTEEY